MSGFISYERDFDALKLLVDAAKNAGEESQSVHLKRFVPKDPDAPPAGARIVEDLSTATPGALTYPVSTYVPGGPHVANAAVGADAAEEEELTPQHTFVVEFYPGYRNKVKVTKSVMGREVARVPAPTHYGSVREGYQDASSHPFGVSLGTRLFSVEERGPEAAQAMAHEDALVILGFKKVYEGQLERIADEEMRAAPRDGYQVKVQRKGHDHWVDATGVDAINNASERAVAGFGSKHLSRLRNAETTKALDSGECRSRRRRTPGGAASPSGPCSARTLANVDDVDDGDDECASASSPAGPGAALELAKQSAESRGDMAAVSPPRTRSRGARADDVAPTLDDDAADAPSVESSAKSDAAEPPQDGEGDARNPSPLSAIGAAALVAAA
ncbi:hypothetical protein JL720_7888 [Aureococcus anophagefferens]|nr:hypothetical protein JL720_7888 [Aureococcus anophagefferens]